MTLKAAVSSVRSGASPERTPRHVAVIMDGNGRWATLRGMARTDGHRAGTKNIRGTIEAFKRAGVEYLTLYAFSTENWNRPSGEVNALISLIDEVIRTEVQDLHRKGVRIRHIGSLDRLPKKLRKSIRQSIELTKHNSGLTLCVAFNYGARAELVSVVKRMLTDGVDPETVGRGAVRELSAHCGRPGPRPHHKDSRRDAPLQLSAVAGRIRRVLFHARLLARLRRNRSRKRAGSVPAAQAQIRSSLRLSRVVPQVNRI